DRPGEPADDVAAEAAGGGAHGDDADEEPGPATDPGPDGSNAKTAAPQASPPDTASSGDTVAPDSVAPDTGAPEEAEEAAGEPSATGETVPAAETSLVAVVPGVPRYHQPDCVLIRFMPHDDVQQLTVPAASEAGCTPCAVCRPAE
ncbi:MAG TPA: hypothetical protein VHF26_11695, partial [Trebonia sp.]|nr:hypothetical protein [Trebonia sp.]